MENIAKFNDDRLWNEKALVLHLVPCVRLTLNCCSFPVSAHISVPAASLLPLQLFGTPFLWPFVVVAPLTVFGANSKLSSITLLSGLLNAPPHPAPQIRRVFRRHCALYKFTYLLTYLQIYRRVIRHMRNGQRLFNSRTVTPKAVYVCQRHGSMMIGTHLVVYR